MQVRVKHEQNYLVMDSRALRHSPLSLKARGLLATMLDEPPEWNYSIAGLAAIIPDGKCAIRNAIEELIAAGYVVKGAPMHDAHGKFTGYEYTVYEIPHHEMAAGDTAEEIDPRQMTLADVLPEPEPEKPAKPKVDYKAEFEEIWKIYPRKRSKDKACKAYIKARKAGTSKEEIEAGVKAYVAEIAAKGTPETYIAYGSTWFSQARWTDVYDGASNRPQSGNPFMDMLMEV